MIDELNELIRTGGLSLKTKITAGNSGLVSWRDVWSLLDGD